MKLFLLVLCVVVSSFNKVKSEIALKRQSRDTETTENNHRIVGGISSFAGELPWQGLLVFSANGIYLSCGCSLLDQQWVVTAAHCTEGQIPSSIRLVLNLHDTRFIVAANFYSISDIKDHPLYNPSTLEDDISLLKVSENVATSSNVRPIALPAQGVSETVGKNCTISGWGTTSYRGETSQVLQKATVPIIDYQQCNIWYNLWNVTISRKTFCAGYREGGIDTCQGDSGGPLACPDETGRYILQGITSFGIGCALPETPGVYTMVSEYVTWINEIRGLTIQTTSTESSTTEISRKRATEPTVMEDISNAIVSKVSDTMETTTNIATTVEITMRQETPSAKSNTTQSIFTTATVTTESKPIEATKETTEKIITTEKITYLKKTTLPESNTFETTAAITATAKVTNAVETATTRSDIREIKTTRGNRTKVENKSTQETILTTSSALEKFAIATETHYSIPHTEISEAISITDNSTKVTSSENNITDNTTSGCHSFRYFQFSKPHVVVAIVMYLLKTLL